MTSAGRCWAGPRACASSLDDPDAGSSAAPGPDTTADAGPGASPGLSTAPGFGPTLGPGAGPEARANPMAWAALEMAAFDLGLGAAGRSLATHLGATATTVPAGAAIGLGPPEAVAERAAELAAGGFGRVKLKIQPGHDQSVVAAVQAAAPGVEVQVDANGAYGPADLPLLRALVESGIGAIEQPFPTDDPTTAARLVETSPIPVVADEAAPDLATVARLHQQGALSGVSIKPARLGGIRPALGLLLWCVGHGIAATAGGMVESGLGRHALAAVAGLDGFTLTGDLSPARRWVAADPWPDLTLVDGAILTPSGPGVAPPPDQAILDDLTIRRTVLTV